MFKTKDIVNEINEMSKNLKLNHRLKINSTYKYVYHIL